MLKQYAAREGTNRLHAGEIQQAYGYRDFADPAVQQDLVGWLEARTRLASERPGVLFDLATGRLLEAKVLLPGPTVLARLVASVRDQAATRLWEVLAAAPDAGQRARLEALLIVADGERSSTLDRLRRGPTSVTAGALLGALHRLEEIRALGVGGLDLGFVPPGRLEALEWVTAPASTPPARSPADSEDGAAGCVNHRTGPRHQSRERGPTPLTRLQTPRTALRPLATPRDLAAYPSFAASPTPTASTAAARLLRPPTGPADAPSRAPHSRGVGLHSVAPERHHRVQLRWLVTVPVRPTNHQERVAT